MKGNNPSEKKQLEAWATLRDEKLRELSHLDTEIEAKKTKNIELGASNSDIEKRININLGRLAELEKKEKERESLVSVEVLNLEKRKSTLVSEIVTLEVKKSDLEKEQKEKVVLFSNIEELFNSLERKVNRLSDVVISINDKGHNFMVAHKVYFDELKVSCETLALTNKENYTQTKIILDKLPRYIFELQKPIPTRRIIVDGRPLSETKKNK